METLKVSARSEPKLVAGAIAAVLRNADSVDLIAIGAASVNQAIKSICVSRGYLAGEGMDVFFLPSFIPLMIEGQEKTGIRFVIEKR